MPLIPRDRRTISTSRSPAVVYLVDAATVTGNTLYVDGGSHLGGW